MINSNIWDIFEYSMSLQMLCILFQVMYTCISEPCLLWFIEDGKSFTGIWTYSSLVCPYVIFRRHDYYNFFQNLHEKMKFLKLWWMLLFRDMWRNTGSCHNYIACTGTEFTFFTKIFSINSDIIKTTFKPVYAPKNCELVPVP